MLVIGDLQRAVAEVLSETGHASQPSGRVKDLPDPRTIRYYTSHGYLDRPEIRGRVAYYGRRHLLQLVAIKRLQLEGLSLADIQARLLNASDCKLERLANLPEGFWERLFARRTAPAADDETAHDLDVETGHWLAVPEVPSEPPRTDLFAPTAVSAVHVRLAPGVSLVIETGGHQRSNPARTDTILRIVAPFAQKLTEALRREGLVPAPS